MLTVQLTGSPKSTLPEESHATESISLSMSAMMGFFPSRMAVI